MKRIIWILIIVGIVAAAAFRLKTNHEKINKVKTDSGILKVVNVNVALVTEKSLDKSLDLTGTLYPFSELNIAAQSQGQITSLNAEQGQYKTKGSEIGTIDNKLELLAVKNAQITELKLKRDLERIQNLYNGGSTTEQQLDETRNAYENAKIQLEQAEKQLTDASITAPISGIITKKYVEEGTFINPGSPVASIIDISKLKIKINASESIVYQLYKDEKVIVITEVYPGIEFPGVITFVSDKGDESHNYPVEVEIKNSRQHPLKAGTFVNVKIDQTKNEKVLAIPREALVGSAQDASVYVAENGKAFLRRITIKSGSGEYLQVLSGLNNGEKVIITGQINLTHGKEINIVEN